MKVIRETEWDEEQQAWMLALRLYRAQVGPCGHYLPHTTAPEAEELYVAPDPTRCHACTAIAMTAEAWRDKTTHPQALLFGVERRKPIRFDDLGG